MLFEPPYQLSLSELINNNNSKSFIKMKDKISNISSTTFSQLTRNQQANGPSMAMANGGTTFRPSFSSMSKEYLFKVLVIGEMGTGKTSFIKRYVHHFFSSHYRATIGVDFALKVINWSRNTIVRIQLWDIAGQERFGHMTRVYYKEAAGAFIVFDVSRPATFDAVLKWKADLDSKVALPDGSPIPCLLLANKCDDTPSLVDETTLNKFCQENGFIGWFYTSSKENINVEEAASLLIRKIIQSKRSEDTESIGTSKDFNQVLSLTAKYKKTQDKCC